VIDRSALEQAREGFRRPGYKIIEELLIGLGVQKSTLDKLLRCETAARHHAITKTESCISFAYAYRYLLLEEEE
jgi:hypothetical protein